jgi:hypothetical protein
MPSDGAEMKCPACYGVHTWTLANDTGSSGGGGYLTYHFRCPKYGLIKREVEQYRGRPLNR